MFVKDWLLPILIGIVAAIALISILYNNPTVKQAFADIGAMMQLNVSHPQVMPVMQPFENSASLMQLEAFSVKPQPKYDTSTDSFTESLNDMGSPIELQNRESYDTKVWNPLPSQYSCTSEKKNESNLSNQSKQLNILNTPDIYNYYPQITNKL